MKFKVKTDLFVEELKKANKVINKQTQIQSLVLMKLEVSDKKIVVMTSDGTITSRILIDDFVFSKGGELLVNSQNFYDCVKRLNSEDVTCELANNNLVVKGGKKKFTLNTVDVNEYPNIKDEEYKKSVVLMQKDLLKGLYSTHEMVSKNTNPVLTGINIKINKDKITLIATDSYRLAKFDIVNSQADFDDIIDCILPIQSVKYLISVLNNTDEKVVISLGETTIKIRVEKQLLKSQLISGQYPDLSKVINQKLDKRLVISKERLDDVIDCFIFNSNQRLIGSFEFKENSMIAESKSQEFGRFKEVIEDIDYNGIVGKVSFDVEYFKQALKTLDDGNVDIYFNDLSLELKPFVIKSNKDNYELLHIILPVRVFE